MLTVVSLVFGIVTSAAPQQKPILADPVGQFQARRVAAEADVKQLRSKGAEQTQASREAYVAAANAHNAWVERMCVQIDTNAAAPGDLQALAKTAAAAFATWYVEKMRALGQTTHASAAEVLTRHAVQLYGALAASPGQDCASLRRRLLWRTWAEVAGD